MCLVEDHTVFQKAELDLLRKAIVARNTDVIGFSFGLLPLSLTPTEEATEFLTLKFLTYYLKTVDTFFSLGLDF